jgi:general secretion pathway protein H
MSKSTLQRSRLNFLRRQHGFTLLEVLVVLVIISVIIGFAVLSIDTGPEELRREGSRIASLLELASEEAVMNGRECRMVLRRHGYSFELLRDGKWQSAEDELFRPRQLPNDISLQLFLENQEVMLNDEADPDAAKSGALLLLSSGEITPFELTVSGAATTKVNIHCDGSEIATSS